LAIDRLAAIAEYIATENLSAAQKLVDEIFKRASDLKQFPQIGRIVPETERPDIREILFQNYRIIYRVKPKEVGILTVRHVRQLLPLEETK
jgi:plasmid stabilization system protein ParE